MQDAGTSRRTTSDPEPLSLRDAAPLFTGLAVRIVFLLLARGLEPWSDEAHYLQLAAIWERFGLYMGSPRFVWPPGYPAFLAFWMELVPGDPIFAAKLAQVGLSAIVGTSVLVLGRWVFSARVGRLGAWLWAGYLPLIGFSHYLWPETVFLAVFLPAVLLFARLLDERSEETGGGWFALLGVLLGAGLLIKESSLLVAPAMAAVLLVTPSDAALKRRAMRAAIVLLALGAVVFPWILRNHEVYGRWASVSSTLGRSLYWGVNGHYANFDNTLSPDEVYPTDSLVYRHLIQPPRGTRWTPSSGPPNVLDRSRRDSQKAVHFIRQHPGYVARSRLKHVADWVTPLSFFDRHHRLGLYQGFLARPVVRIALVLSSVGLVAAVLFGAGWGFITRIENPRARLVFLVPLLAFAATVPIHSMSRFRTPIEPLLLVLAAGFFAGTGRPRGRVAAWVFSGLLLALWAINARETLAELAVAMGA